MSAARGPGRSAPAAAGGPAGTDGATPVAAPGATDVAAPGPADSVGGTGHPIRLLTQMIRIRRFEERCVELYSDTRIRGFLHLGIGEEACAVGVMEALGPDDAVVSTYREHGHALARGMTMRSVMAELEGKVEGCSRGRGGSMHLFDAATRFYGGNAIVGGGIPLAVGLALADHLRGRPRVTACFFGDGAVAEGEFHESMNLAALWHLPVLFCCENNLYAMGTALNRSESEIDLSLKAASYRVPSWEVDGMDVVAVEQAASRACESIRGGGGPHFLELKTYRYRAHSMYDPDRYRDKAEIAHWKGLDPIAKLSSQLTDDRELGPGQLERIEADTAAEVDDAVAFADAGTLEPVTELGRFVLSEPAPPGAGR